MKRNYEEDNTLVDCVNWCDGYFKRNWYDFLLKQENKHGIIREVAPLMHAAAERKTTERAGKRLKDKGQRAGYPDVDLKVPMNGYSGLLIEMKSKKGRLSPNQKHWDEFLNRYPMRRNNYAYAVCRSLREFQKTVTDYMEGKLL